MINKILQFIKKQQLAIRFARFDCLFIIDSLHAFRLTLPLARLFRHAHHGTENERLFRFLEQEQNPLYFAVYKELSARPDIFTLPMFVFPVSDRNFNGDVLYRLAANAKSKKFYFSLFRQIIKENYPELDEQYRLFEKRLDSLYDMRFYASELEQICAESAGYYGFCPYEVDWLKTTKEKLCLSFDVPCVSKSRLSLAEQEKLSHLFAYLLFEKSLFVSYWRSLCVGSDSRVSFLDFDAIYPVYPELRQFLFDFVSRHRKPRRPEEHRVYRAILVLQHFCPEINIFTAWEAYLQPDSLGVRVRSDNDNLMHQLQSSGLDLGQYHPTPLRGPEELSYLLQSQDLKKGAQFRKSSIVYWGPLAVLFYVLLNYF